MEKKSWILAACALALARDAGAAADWSGKLGFSGEGLAAFPAGEKPVRDLSKDAGVGAGGMLSYGLSPHWALGASFHHINLQSNAQKVDPVLMNALYRVTPGRRWSPVLQGGLGAAQVTREGRFDNLAAQVGLGYDYLPCSGFSAGPRMTYTYAHDNGDGQHRYHIVGVGLSASFYLGGEAKRSPAPPPTEAEAPMPAAAGAAPAVPADADQDGVPDNADRCPNTPAGAPADPEGCPLDSDGDGAPDFQDRCADTASGIPVNADGCPRKIDQQVSVELKVLFDAGQAAVKPQFRSEIGRVANFLNTYPDIHAAIEGHTDSLGPDTANERLSQRRADAVRDLLIRDFGIDPARVRAAGYGEARPIADNATAEGRAKNRRVVATLEAVPNPETLP